MALFGLAMIFLTAVILGNLLGHYFQAVPVAIFQIALGIVIYFIFRPKLEIEVDWFLMIFVAPLLFNDAWRFPRNELWNLRGPILSNAFALVFISTLVGGLVVNLIIPQFTLFLSFALIAILSPTDPIAVVSISRRFKFPERILHVVVGESLINDAAGLVAFKYAMITVTTGQLVFKNIALNFIYFVVVGVIVGFLMMSLIDFIRETLINSGLNDAVFQTLISILSPFTVYFVSEHFFHASGLISVVIAGITTKLHTDISESDSNEFVVVSQTVWRTIAFILSGAVFVMMGTQLPSAMDSIIYDHSINTFVVIGYSIIVWMLLLGVRIIWTMFNLYMSEGKDFSRQLPANFKVALISGLSGVRGAVTLAGVMSAQTIAGQSFVEHDLMMFIASFVVLLSLTAAAIALPILTNNEISATIFDDVDNAGSIKTADKSISEKQAILLSNYAAIEALQKATVIGKNNKENTETQAAVYSLISRYQFSVSRNQYKSLSRNKAIIFAKKESELRSLTLAAETQVLKKLYDEHKIGRYAYRKNYRIIYNNINNLSTSPNDRRITVSLIRRLILVNINRFLLWIAPVDSKRLEFEDKLTQKARYKAAIETIENYKTQIKKPTDLDLQVISNLKIRYKSRLSLLTASSTTNQHHLQRLNELQMIALDAERRKILELFYSNKITSNISTRLLQKLNYGEIRILGEQEL